MLDQNTRDARSTVPAGPAWMRKALHDLCQPLTTLDCLLYLNSLPDVESVEQANPMALQKTIYEATIECSRMMTMVRSIQERMSLEETAGVQNTDREMPSIER